MIFKMISSWWRGLPQKTRVRLIASVLLIFAGTELFVLAPAIFDIALMIDVGGLVFVLAALRSSVSVSMLQLRMAMTVVTKPLFAITRSVERVNDFGSVLSAKWHRRYFSVTRMGTRFFSAALLVVFVGLALTKALVVFR